MTTYKQEQTSAVRSRLLADKVAVVSAAGSGMGRASALRFAAEGATVAVVDLSEEAAASVVEEIESAGGNAEVHVADVSDLDAYRAVFSAIEDRHKRLDVLFHHAGIPGPAGLDVSEEEWQSTIDINLRAVFYAVRYARPLLGTAGGGSVILTSSVVGLVGSPLSPMYSMTKGGVVLLAKSLALMLAGEGIRVNAICPGSIDTPMFPTFFERYEPDEAARRMEAWVSSIPMKRIGRPEEIASAALFLASDLSSYVTGHALPVDGGITAG